nr:MAG TPA: Protein of unknown function (DUF717) [Caudoviricetes sp.]
MFLVQKLTVPHTETSSFFRRPLPILLPKAS